MQSVPDADASIKRPSRQEAPAVREPRHLHRRAVRLRRAFRSTQARAHSPVSPTHMRRKLCLSSSSSHRISRSRLLANGQTSAALWTMRTSSRLTCTNGEPPLGTALNAGSDRWSSGVSGAPVETASTLRCDSVSDCMAMCSRRDKDRTESRRARFSCSRTCAMRWYECCRCRSTPRTRDADRHLERASCCCC